jgi:hypothetical protein
VGSRTGWYSVRIAGGTAAEIDLTALRSAGVSQMAPLGFTRDQALVFNAVHGGSYNIWQVRMTAAGDIGGAPHRVTAGTAEIAGFPALDGRIPYNTGNGIDTIYRIALDPKTGAAAGEPQRVVFGSAGGWAPTVTYDGRLLVFTSGRALSSDIWMKDLGTGEEKPVVATPPRRYAV